MSVRVIPPRGDKNCMFEFVSTSKLETLSYNHAIKDVMNVYNEERRNNSEHPHAVFHQVGVCPMEGDTKAGYHGWEIWGGDQNKLEALVPQIVERAREVREEHRQWYSSSADYWAEMTEERELDPILDKLRDTVDEECAILCELHAPPETQEQCEHAHDER